MSTLALAGFILVIVLVALVIWGKVSLPPVLILLPTVAVIILGLTGNLIPIKGTAAFKDFSAGLKAAVESGAVANTKAGTLAFFASYDKSTCLSLVECFTVLKSYLGTGLNSTLNTAALFTFAVVFFNILADAGLFDTIVGWVMKFIGNKVSLVLLMTYLLTAISHLDGSGATTWLITAPTMLPLFTAMNISPIVLLLEIALVSGVENMLPWTSALSRVSAACDGVEARELWMGLVPAQVVGMLLLLAMCFVLGPILQKRGAGMSDEKFAEIRSGMFAKKEHPLKVSKTILAIDGVLLVVIVASLLAGWVNTNVAFMIGLAIALLLNCKGAKEMTAQVKKHGSNALNMVMIIFSIGMLVGVMKDTYMMDEMTTFLVGLIPASMGKHLSFIIGLVAVPLSMAVGSDALYMVMAPIFGNMAAAFGGTMMSAAAACTIGACCAVNLCLVAPTPYLALGLCGVEMKDNLKYCFLPTWALSIILLVVAAISGFIPF